MDCPNKSSVCGGCAEGMWEGKRWGNGTTGQGAREGEL